MKKTPPYSAHPGTFRLLPSAFWLILLIRLYPPHFYAVLPLDYSRAMLHIIEHIAEPATYLTGKILLVPPYK
ncbi:hypothetical protein F5X98DRAFT_346719 [Xylaria grammica]|nr:hypothetical protein F5X98DRAFT_346719 [Xylaria grammica]